MRIISLVPSITELLYDLNLGESVVGITKFCIHPRQWFQSKTRVGGPKKLHIDIIRNLEPDLIIANKEENIKEEIEECETFCKVLVTKVSNYGEALEMIGTVGKWTGREKEADNVMNEINSAFDVLKSETRLRKRVVYLIWQNPLMTIGGDTYINNMIERIGWENIFAHENRYPQITEQQLIDAHPDILLLSSEPYPFSEKHIPYFQNILPGTKILNVDGEPFCWYGSRMRYAPEYFRSLKI